MDRIKRLGMSDIPQIKDLFWECHTEEAKRASVKKGVNYEESIASIPEFWQLWITGMQKYYLNNGDKHFLYGIFDENDKLMCFLGWRCDIPVPYEKDWIIVYLKSRPDINATVEYMPILWRYMFDRCEESGLIRYHSLIEPDRLTRYDSFYRRKIPEIDNRYTFETTMVIPAGSKPDVDWVWGMMGRRPLKIDYILRTGTLKNV